MRERERESKRERDRATRAKRERAKSESKKSKERESEREGESERYLVRGELGELGELGLGCLDGLRRVGLGLGARLLHRGQLRFCEAARERAGVYRVEDRLRDDGVEVRAVRVQLVSRAGDELLERGLGHHHVVPQKLFHLSEFRF